MKDEDIGKKIRSFLEKKLTLFNRYLSVTDRMKETLTKREGDELGALISERQSCINKINKIDVTMDKIIKAGMAKTDIPQRLKELTAGYVESAKRILEVLEPLDKELVVIVKEESGSIKRELLKMRNVRKANRGYGQYRQNPSKFIDIRK